MVICHTNNRRNSEGDSSLIKVQSRLFKLRFGDQGGAELPSLARALVGGAVSFNGPKDPTSIRVLHSGSKTHYKGDTRNRRL